MSDTQLSDFSDLTDAVKAISGQLDSMDKKFEKRFQAIDSRFDAMDDRLDAMDNRFDAMDNRFDAMDNRFNTMENKFDDQFTKLFRYSQKEFDKIHKRLDQTTTKAELNIYVNAVDAFAKQTETYQHEMLALGHKVDRHEKWHQQTAKAVGIKLSA